jgi:eukaryotic-like serine/threonine-protein kinase
MTEPESRSAWDRIRRAGPLHVLGVYLGVAFGILQAIDIFANRLPIPDWTFVVALVLLAIGLPVVLATSIVQSQHRRMVAGSGQAAGERRSEAGTSAASAAEPSLVQRLLTWPRTLSAGAAGFAGLALLVMAIMTLGAFGVGPAGTLIAKGVIAERERLLIAEFSSQTRDTVLAGAVTEAFRVDFEQSTLVTPLPPSFVRDALTRMGRPVTATLDAETAIELALREGIKAVVAGEINAAGGSFVLSARLLSAEDGSVLASFRETAADSSAIIAAVDRLSKSLRQRIGESLRSLRANDSLERVSTPSIEALRRYSQAVRASDVDRDHARAVALLEEAIRHDPGFAMAYRKLGIVLQNDGAPREGVLAALRSAYEHRDRLTDRERYLMLGTYHTYVDLDPEQAITAYRTLLELYPDDTAALNNLAVAYNARREHARAEDLYRRAIALDPTVASRYTNLIVVLVSQGRWAAADSILDEYRRRFPEQPHGALFAAGLAFSRFDFDRATALAAPLAADRSVGVSVRANAHRGLGSVALIHGQFDTALRHYDALAALTPHTVASAGPISRELAVAEVELFVTAQPDSALRRTERALARYPLAQIPPEQRPYAQLIYLFADLERPERAAALYAEQVAVLDDEQRRERAADLRAQRAIIARAHGRFEEALRELRAVDAESACAICTLPELARTYRAAQQPDSAVAVLNRYIETPWYGRHQNDAIYLSTAHEMLAELYEERGERALALQHWARLTELWRAADPIMQPRVARARAGVSRLAGMER